jgi:hypothetical protein
MPSILLIRGEPHFSQNPLLTTAPSLPVTEKYLISPLTTRELSLDH